MLYLDVAAAAPVRRDLLERHAEFCREYVATPTG